MLLRYRDAHLANISIYLAEAHLDAYGQIQYLHRKSPIFSKVIELFDPVLPYKFPFPAFTESKCDYYALVIQSDVDIWWRFPGLIPALPKSYASQINSFQQSLDGCEFSIYASSCPFGTEYFPSIFAAGGQQCAPATPSASPTPSVTASATASSSSTRTHTATRTSSRTNSPLPFVPAPNRLLTFVTPSATATITPTPSATPCAGDYYASYFTNIDPTVSILELLDMVRLKAREPFAITFTPPCTGCTFNLSALDLILKATVPRFDASFSADLCQYDNSHRFIINCISAAHTANFTLEEIPTFYRLPLHLSYTIAHGLTGDLKLIITPSVDMQWMLSKVAPAIPATGVSNATAVLVQPPCSADLVSVAWASDPVCPYVASWDELGLYPAMSLHGSVPCFVPEPCVEYIDLLEYCSRPTDLEGQCYDSDHLDVVDTIKNHTLTNTGALRVIANSTAYSIFFPNPCNQIPTLDRRQLTLAVEEGPCAWKPSLLTLPLQALANTKLTLTVRYHNGGPGSPAEFEHVHLLTLAPSTEIAFIDVSLYHDYLGHAEHNVQGITLVFSQEVLWHYGLPLVSFSLHDTPLITVEPAVAYFNTSLYHGFVLPGVRLTTHLINQTCCEAQPLRLLLAQVGCLDECILSRPTPLPVLPPIPCFGTGSILVADNTLESRFLFASGTLLLPNQHYAISFNLPCSECNVHLTHLTLPLGLFVDSSLVVNISIVILKNGASSGVFTYDATLNTGWIGIGASKSLLLTTPRGFYTLLLPDAFTLAALLDPSLSYAMVITVSKKVLWFDGLALPSFAETLTGYSDPVARLLVEDDYGTFLQSSQIPGVWLRSWAEPWWQCLPAPSTGPYYPSATPTHHVVPYVSATPSRIPVSVVPMRLVTSLRREDD
jgi:hypothetical protein